ncbi:MAG: hypothetical protein J7L45_03055 [Candidatus Aenigmarchaeota archaeon]|nr:hypothetical protein [Candidatus Aenigmarchaeota archaeon]
MQIEEGILFSVDKEKGMGKVKLGKNRIRDVKLTPSEEFEEGDKVRVILGLVIGKA